MSSSHSGSTLARFTPASTPAWMSASISARVMRTSDPSPMRVGMRSIAPPSVSSMLPTAGTCRYLGRGLTGGVPRLQGPSPAVSGGYFGKVDGAAGQGAATARSSRPGRRERHKKGRGPAGNGASYKGFGANPRGGGSSLASERSHSHHPQRLLRRCEAARTREKHRLPVGYRAGAESRGVGWIRALKMAEGRRIVPLLGAAARRPSGRGSPGAGANQEDRRYQHLPLAAGFSETGSVARRTLWSMCCETVNQILTDMKLAAERPFVRAGDSGSFMTVLDGEHDNFGQVSAICPQASPLPPVNSRSLASSMTTTPSAFALSSLDPGSSPATT